MSEMQIINRNNKRTTRYGNRAGNRGSLLHLRILDAGFSEIITAGPLGKSFETIYHKVYPQQNYLQTKGF